MILFTSKSCIKCKVVKRELTSKNIIVEEIYIDDGKMDKLNEMIKNIGETQTPKSLPILIDLDNKKMYSGDDAIKFSKTL